MNVLHVSPAFFPATYWGGPIFSLYGLCNALASRPGVVLKVLATDAAGPMVGDRVTTEPSPIRYPGGYDVVFVKRLAGNSIAPAMIGRVWSLVNWADVVHLTSVYSFSTFPSLIACNLLNKPLVWSPRGALRRWPGTTRPTLKKAWELLCAGLLRTQHSVIHVTSQEEAFDTAVRIHNARIEIVPNGVDMPHLADCRSWIPDDILRLLYVGRLHPIKGLENLLQAVAGIKNRSWTLRICGDGEEAYVNRLSSLAQELSISRQVKFVGHVEGQAKSDEFLHADACIVPSFSESFGMVVAEALAHGVPVVVSRGAPWADIEARGCGLWVDNSPDSLAVAIETLRKRDLSEMGSKGRDWMREHFGWEAVADRTLSCYKALVAGG